MRLIGLCIGFVVCAGAGSARADVSADALPLAVPSYQTRDTAAEAASFAGEDHAYYFQSEPAPGLDSKQQSYWPVLYSALVPGLGELTMGYKVRGIALMTIDVASWIGYFSLHQDGLDKREEYEAFADQYWAQRKFIDDHPLVWNNTGWTQEELEAAGQGVSGSGGPWWNGYIPWVSKEEDKQHYYENIGKYDWFVSGWSDYDPTLNPPLAKSALRDQYRDMRGESNNALDDANAFVWVSLAARAVSIVETAIIVRNRRDDGAQSSVLREQSFAVRARPRGFDGGEVALEVRFK